MIAKDERRSSLRWSVDAPIRVLSDARSDVLGQVVNLSEGGMMVTGERSFAAGSRLEICLEFPDADGALVRRQTHAEVVWSGYSEAENRHSAGLKFAARQKKLLADVLHLLSPAPERRR